jgi:GTPase SAR1 family protein
LRYLGYSDPLQTAVIVTKKRSKNITKGYLVKRTSIRAFVFGDSGVGKTCLLNALVSKEPRSRYGWSSVPASTPTGVSTTSATLTGVPTGTTTSTATTAAASTKQHAISRSAINRIRMIGVGVVPSAADESQQQQHDSLAVQYLILTEVPSSSSCDELIETDFVDCDLGIMMFDVTNAESARRLGEYQKMIPQHVPCVYIGNKCDLIDASGTANATPSENTNTNTNTNVDGDNNIPEALSIASKLCAAYNLPSPELISLSHINNNNSGTTTITKDMKQKQSNMERLFSLLYSTALHPDTAQPMSEQQRVVANRNRMIRSALRISLVASIVAAGVVLFSYVYIGRRR